MDARNIEEPAPAQGEAAHPAIASADSGGHGDGASGSDAFDSDSDSAFSSAASPGPSFAPVFRPSSQRSTLSAREGREDDGVDEGAAQVEHSERQRRREHSQQAARQQLHRDEQRIHAVRAADGPPTDDDGDEDAQERERDEWKLREIRRIQRDRQRAQQRTEQREDGHEREEEQDARGGREAEDGAGRTQRGSPPQSSSSSSSLAPPPPPPPSSMRYLQRYYHAGAFFSDEREADAAFSRDVRTVPTGEDRTVDRTLLPAVMQVSPHSVTAAASAHRPTHHRQSLHHCPPLTAFARPRTRPSLCR